MSLSIDVPPQNLEYRQIIFQLFIAFDKVINDQRTMLNNVSNIMRRAKVISFWFLRQCKMRKKFVTIQPWEKVFYLFINYNIYNFNKYNKVSLLRLAQARSV